MLFVQVVSVSTRDEIGQQRSTAGQAGMRPLISEHACQALA